MPEVLRPRPGPVWLGQEQADPKALKALLVSGSGDDMICWPGQPARRQRQEHKMAENFTGTLAATSTAWSSPLPAVRYPDHSYESPAGESRPKSADFLVQILRRGREAAPLAGA
jgi:hypothetical protein